MKLIYMSLLFTAILLCCPALKAHAITLTAEDVKFLRSCDVEQADIDVIPKLPSDGQEKLGLVLKSSQKNCDMETIKSFKATREFIKKYTPPPTEAPKPVAGWRDYFLTKAEYNYMRDINNRLFEQLLERLRKQ